MSTPKMTMLTQVIVSVAGNGVAGRLLCALRVPKKQHCTQLVNVEKGDTFCTFSHNQSIQRPGNS